MNKYLMVIMCCMLIGIPIAYNDPTEGGLREEPYTGLFFVSIIQFIAYLLTRNIESLSLRRNTRLLSLVLIFIGSYFYWNTCTALIKKQYAADLSSSTKSISKNSLLFRKLFTKGVDLDPGLITTFLTSVLISFSKNNFICLS